MPRPKLYTPEEIQDKWNEYVDFCTTFGKEHPTSSGKVVTTSAPRIPTIGGFARFLKLDPQTLLNYEAEGEYFGTIKGVKKFIELWKQDALVNGEGQTNALIFDMKVNYGWKETNFVKHEGFTPIEVEIVDGKGKQSLRQDSEE
jgi:hypothetical protein